MKRIITQTIRMLRLLPEQWMITERNHIFNDPEDSTVMTQKIFTKRDKFLTGSLR